MGRTHCGSQWAASSLRRALHPSAWTIIDPDQTTKALVEKLASSQLGRRVNCNRPPSRLTVRLGKQRTKEARGTHERKIFPSALAPCGKFAATGPIRAWLPSAVRAVELGPTWSWPWPCPGRGRHDVVVTGGTGGPGSTPQAAGRQGEQGQRVPEEHRAAGRKG